MKQLDEISRRGRQIVALSLSLAALVAVSFASMASPFYNEQADAASAACNNLTIKGVTASAEDSNDPENTIDNNLSTRWSSNGIGSWIGADLEQQKAICSVDIAWYRGDTRTNNVISVSSEGTAFTNVYSGKNSGTTSQFEKYSIQEVSARYVKITAIGNSMNQWASITEIDVNRKSTTTGGDGGTSNT
jgi:F5/8 type C domain